MDSLKSTANPPLIELLGERRRRELRHTPDFPLDRVTFYWLQVQPETYGLTPHMHKRNGSFPHAWLLRKHHVSEEAGGSSRDNQGHGSVDLLDKVPQPTRPIPGEIRLESSLKFRGREAFRGGDGEIDKLPRLRFRELS